MVIETDPRFWDCECEDHFIQLKVTKMCIRCKANQDDMPDSRVNELDIENLAPRALLLMVLSVYPHTK